MDNVEKTYCKLNVCKASCLSLFVHQLKTAAVINIRKYKRISEKKKGFILTFRMFQQTSSEVVNR